MEKKEVKLLVLSDTADFDKDEMIEELNTYKRRTFDMVFILGTYDEGVLREASSIFESALVCLLPKYHYPEQLCEQLGAVDYHLKNMEVKDVRDRRGGKGTRVLGYGSQLLHPNEEPIDKLCKYSADILVSYHGPMRMHMRKDVLLRNNTEIINRYGAYQEPKVIIHGERKMNKITPISNGTMYVSCYGIKPLTITIGNDSVLVKE